MSIFKEEWLLEAKNRIKMLRPDLDEDTIRKYLNNKFKKCIQNPKCIVDNNYCDISSNTDLISLYDYLHIKNPIIGGYGVFFRNQNQSVNNIARMIKKFLESRSIIKTRMKKHLEMYGPDSYEYKQDDRLQGAEKVNANACYGAGGANSSFSYNLYAAASTTATAQSLISTACAAFESFMSNNTKFYDLDEIIFFIKNIISEKTSLSLFGIKPQNINSVKEKLLSGCFNRESININLLDSLLENLDSEQLTRVYYKNNLFEFTKNCSPVWDKLSVIMKNTETFRAPEKKYMTKELEENLSFIWDYYSEFVHYNHPIYNRIFRLKTSKRESVIVIDTDSNMIHIKKWIDLILNNFEYNDKTEAVYIATSVLGVFLSNMIQNTLNTYCKNANIPEEYWKNINMKNEFFYETLITSSVKKNYMGKVLLREGKDMHGSLDIKGLSFMKSGLSASVGEYMKNIIKEDIMGDKINFRNIIYKLNLLSENIKQSLLSGFSEWTKPVAVKSKEHYKNPLNIMGYKAVIVWNLLQESDPILLPDNVKIIKIKLSKKKDLELIKDYPVMYEKIKEKIFDNEEEKISHGITSIAIPQTYEKIPEWIIPLIDIDSIVEDNIKSFFPVLESLGLEIINTRATNTMYSNIIKI